MSAPQPTGLDADVARLRELAAGLAAAWAPITRRRVTSGQERAILRLLGVGGVDAAGRPLAVEVVDRYLSTGHHRLATGILLPFVAGLLEYETTPQALALDVASGAVDLGLESEVLGDPARRRLAESEARRLVAAGVDRIDANRVARRELQAVLGEPGRPLVGLSVREEVATDALAEARAAVRDGVDLLRVEVPSGRELTARLKAAGVTVRPWGPSAGQIAGAGDGADVAPTGSQRGLAALRSAIDRAAAERPGYVRLAIAAQALSAPEAAVVAGMERVDLVESDPIDEIVAVGVDPDRALADHAFARRILWRAGAGIVIGAGPLVVAPDLARGVPSDPAVRAGRALALQLLSAALAAAEGLPPDQVVIGAIPAWLLGEGEPFARAAAEICLRRTLLPDHPLVFVEPLDTPASGLVRGVQSPRGSWPFLLGALLPAPPAGAIVLRRTGEDGIRRIAADTRRAAAVAGELADSRDQGQLRGVSLDHARASLGAAISTLEGLSSGGWGTVVGERPDGVSGGAGWLGRGPDSVTDRADPFDPLAEALAAHPAG